MTLTIEEIQRKFSESKFDEIVSSFERQERDASEDSVYSTFFYAAALFKQESYSKCIDILSQIEAAFSEDTGFWSLYGASLRKIGLREEAEEKFKLAIALSQGKDESVLNNYANLLMDMNKYSDAIKIWEKLIQDHPQYHDAIVNLGEAKRLVMSKTIHPSPSKNYDLGKDQTMEYIIPNPLMAAFCEEQIDSIEENSKIDNKTSQQLAEKFPETNQEKSLKEKLSLFERVLNEQNFSFGIELCSEMRRIGLTEDLYYKYTSDCYLGLKDYKNAELYVLHSALICPDSLHTVINLISFSAMRGDLIRAKSLFGQIRHRDDLDTTQRNKISEMIKSKEKNT